MLKYDTYGDPGAPLLVVAHGLFGSARNWRAISKRLSATHHVVTVNMRNHGGSFFSDQMDYADMAGDLAQVVDHFGGPARVLGHSMGGKAAMVLAVSYPQAVHAAMIADIAPVSYTHGLANLAYIKAMQAVDLDSVDSRKDADVLLAQQIEDPALRSFFLQSLVIEDAGKRWNFNLDGLANSLDAIVGFPKLSGQFDGPVFALNGETSSYVTDAGKAAFRELMPKVRFASLRGAGHWLHAEKPRGFIASAQAFLKAVA